MLHVNLGDILEADFRARCRQEGVPYGAVIRALVEQWLGDHVQVEQPKCLACGQPLYHENSTMPYCCHRCAGITKMEEVKDGDLVVTASGEPGVFNKARGHGICTGCGRRYQDYVIGIAGGKGRYCLRCVVLARYDYSRLLEVPTDHRELLEFIKRGGVLPDETT